MIAGAVLDLGPELHVARGHWRLPGELAHNAVRLADIGRPDCEPFPCAAAGLSFQC